MAKMRETKRDDDINGTNAADRPADGQQTDKTTGAQVRDIEGADRQTGTGTGIEQKGERERESARD
jgi:hypothetical protein